VNSIRRIFIIAQKEVLEATATPLFFILETCFIALSGYFFFLGVDYFSQVSQQWLERPELQTEVLDASLLILPPIFSNFAMLMLFFIPFLTMGSFANEKRHGTLELLFTFPIRDAEIVLGKWMGISFMLILLFLPLWIYPIIYKVLGSDLSLVTFATGFLGLVLLGSFFAAAGLFFSSCFESQTAAAVLTVGVLIFLWSLQSSQLIPLAEWSEWLSNISVRKYFHPFTRGLIGTQNILFFLMGCFLFLFLTFRVLERRYFRNPV